MLSDKVVLMTGAGRGLGRAMTLALLRKGARVVLNSTDPASLDSTIADSGAGSDRAAAIVADLALPGECERVVEFAKAAFGPVNVLINNAGLGTNSIREDYLNNPYRFWDVESGTLERFFAVNSIAPYKLATLLVRDMIARGWGRIVNNTTSLDTMLRIPVYGGSKAALEAHSASMATDLDGTGVTVNVLVPGGAAVSRMTADLGIPDAQLIPAEAMAAPIVWLASNRSDGVTGRRFIAQRWDASLDPDEAAGIAGAPVAWRGMGTPGRKSPPPSG